MSLNRASAPRVVGVAVGVVLARKCAVRALDLVVGRVARDAEHLVVVGHAHGVFRRRPVTRRSRLRVAARWLRPRRAPGGSPCGSDRARRPCPRPRRRRGTGATTIEQSRSSSSEFSEPMRTVVSPWSSSSCTSDTTSTWRSSSSSSRAALSVVGNASLLGREPAGAAHVERFDGLLLGARGERVARLAGEAIGGGTGDRRAARGAGSTRAPASCVSSSAPAVAMVASSVSAATCSDALLDRAVRQDREREHQRRLQADELHAADGRRPRSCGPTTTAVCVLTRASSWLVSCRRSSSTWWADWNTVKKSDTTRRCGRREARLAVEVVDEEAVAAVGGDPTGGRVGLHEVALALEHGHLVAHRGARHPEVARPRDGLRSHRLRGGDVLLHDGPEDRRPCARRAPLALDSTECQRGTGGCSIAPSRRADDLVAQEPAPAREARHGQPSVSSRPAAASSSMHESTCEGSAAGHRELDPGRGAQREHRRLAGRSAAVRVSSPASAERPATTASM